MTGRELAVVLGIAALAFVVGYLAAREAWS